MKVLIVDDQKINRMLPSVLLKQAGCEVFELDNGEAVPALLQANPVDAVLLDISMPGVSGMEVCAKLRKEPAWA